ncbi:hypothetical protein OPV22_006123 [Ensete ventricosum]|uniref:RING-type domain-containing protein n=1 Tax=Ensete ventricosum TaxID=4639 RepID=A0AAV8QAV5_ENSVE|nr:hypothetical protein OPV22_006123 [Ensete ventricosum]
MPPAARFLTTSAPSEPHTYVVVILAALLCAAVSAVGLALVARCCACPWHSLGGGSPRAPPDKGLKRTALRQLPKVSYGGASGGEEPAECPICLAEFEEGEQLRVLPQCGHGFHAGGAARDPSTLRRPRRPRRRGAEAREDGDAHRFLPQK